LDLKRDFQAAVQVKRMTMHKIFAWTFALFVSHAACAQTLSKGPVSQGAVSPADMTERLEKSAIKTQQVSPTGAARGAAVDFSWPQDAEEYKSLGKRVLVLVSVVTQEAAELPLRRVYVSVDGRETELVKLSSKRSAVRKGSTTFSVLGRFREDGFYLAPAGLMMAEGFLQADFAVRRNNFNLYKLPGSPPDFVKADRDPMPVQGSAPDMPAVKTMLHREYKDFDLPASLR
jgi:hypothetical protein